MLLPMSLPAAENTKTISLTAKEFLFAPNTLTLKAGQRVANRLTNTGTMDHEFLSTLLKSAKDVEVKVDGAKVAGEIEEVEVERGHTVTIELTPTRTGTFAFWCAEMLKGKLHRDLGMKGTITVVR
jgi:uncharacterized cupredoxin-like copper-binding protein